MSAPVRWCAIADSSRTSEESRYKALNETLQAAGLASEFEFFTADQASIKDVLEQAQKDFSQIRLVGETSAWILPLLDRLPSALLSLKGADAMIGQNGEWWPRFFLVEGLNQMIATGAGTLDLTGSVFVFGATPQARAAVAALSKVGFNKVIVSDPNEVKGSAFVEDLKKSYFGIQFQAVARQLVTQLPGICSIAVNTLTSEEAQEAATELAYFNFLKPGGYWLDLSIFPISATLQSEAVSVGVSLLSGARAFALTDMLWADAAFKISIDTEAYADRLAF